MKKSILLILILLTLLPSVFAINLFDDFNNFFNNKNINSENEISAENLFTGNAVSQYFSKLLNKRKCTPGPVCQGNNAGIMSLNCKFTKTKSCKAMEKCSDGKCIPKKLQKSCTPQMICNSDGNAVFQGEDCGTCTSSINYCTDGCENGKCKPTQTSNPPTSNRGGGSGGNPRGNSCAEGWTCKDSTHYGYQYGDCSFDQDYYPCQFGCSNGQCNQNPNGNTAGCGNIGACQNGKPGMILNDCTFQPSLTSGCPYGCNSAGTGCACYESFSCSRNADGTTSFEHSLSDCTWVSIPCANGCSFLETPGNPHCAQETICTPGWICEGNNVVFRNGDCSNNSYGINCQNGCSNGQCNPPKPTCNASPKCVDEHTIAYQNVDCTSCGKSICKYGCENGKCKKEPQKTPTCETTPGYKCKDGNNAGYQNADCTWTQTTTCANGCNSLTNACNPPSTSTPGSRPITGGKTIKSK